MHLVVAKDQWLIQDGVGSVQYVTAPIPFSRFDRVSMHLLVRDMTLPSVTGNVTLNMVPQVANQVAQGFVEDTTPLAVTAASPTPSAMVTPVVGAFIRFRFQLVVVTDTYQFRCLYDAHVVLDKA